MDLNVNIKITLDETPGMINCLSALVDSLHILSGRQDAVAAPEKAVKAEASASVTPIEATAVAPIPAGVPVAAPKKYSLAEIQTACAPLMDAGKTDELAALIQSFGVGSLIDLPEDKYGELVVKLRALGARL